MHELASPIIKYVFLWPSCKHTDGVCFVRTNNHYGPVWEGFNRLRLHHCSVTVAWSRRSYPTQASTSPMNSACVSERQWGGEVKRLRATAALQCRWSWSRSRAKPSQTGPTYHHRACGYLGLFFENPCITSFGAVPRTRIKCSNNNTGCICMSKLCELVTIN
jgi:hypothetical protein